MARAVAAWSPVIIFTRMPAARQSRDGGDRLLARRVDQAQTGRAASRPPSTSAKVERAPAPGRPAFVATASTRWPCAGELVDLAMPGVRGRAAPSPPAVALPVAHREQPLRRALDVRNAAPVVVVVQRGHEAVLRVERDHVACAGSARRSSVAVVAGLHRERRRSAPSIGSPSTTQPSSPARRSCASLHRSAARSELVQDGLGRRARRRRPPARKAPRGS